jgi:transglutaminase-like putative cysteine protease
METAQYLAAGDFVDSATPQVIAFAKDATQGETDTGAAILRLYTAVRDGIIYDPYVSLADPANYRASSVLAVGHGFCIGKSALLAAGARAIGVPARVGYADVRNHLTSRRLYDLVKTDTFMWHSYTELYLSGCWVKATPAFDRALCERIGLRPLDFDGQADSLFQPFDQAGRRHMEYLRDRGTFADVPFDVIRADFIANYPSLMGSQGIAGDFHAEAVAEVLDDRPPDEKAG